MLPLHGVFVVAPSVTAIPFPHVLSRPFNRLRSPPIFATAAPVPVVRIDACSRAAVGSRSGWIRFAPTLDVRSSRRPISGPPAVVPDSRAWPRTRSSPRPAVRRRPRSAWVSMVWSRRSVPGPDACVRPQMRTPRRLPACHPTGRSERGGVAKRLDTSAAGGGSSGTTSSASRPARVRPARALSTTSGHS